jgi:branched-chain amino acid transport system substrate-binding protein
MRHRARGATALIAATLVVTACGASKSTSSSTSTGGTSSNNNSASASGTSAGIDTAKNPIKIGVAVAKTSNVALLGQEQVIGAEIAEKFFNDKGGVNGRPIDVIIEDTAGDENGAINAFNALIRNDVVGIVGPTLSQQAFAADPVAEKAKVPVLGPSNTAKGIPQIGNYIARVSSPVAVVAPNAVEQALKEKPEIKNVAVAFAQNDAFSSSETKTFQEVVKAKGLNLALVQTFQTTDTDFTSQATAIIEKKPDLVIVSGLAADGGNLVKQLRELGYKGSIIGGNGLNTANVFPVCGAKCDGILIAQAYNPAFDNPINKEFVAAYKAKQNKQPPQFSGQAFTGVQVFVDALKALDDKEKIADMKLPDLRDKLNAQILAGKYETPLGAISFDQEGEIKQGKFWVAKIKMESDGKTGAFTYVG